MKQGSKKRAWAPVASYWAVLIAVLVVGPACEENPSQTLIVPGGGSGTIRGKLEFQGVPNPPLPQASITTGGSASNCVSDFGAVTLMGNFNEFDLSRGEEFELTEDPACFWVGRLVLDAGLVEFKFVTGNDNTSFAFDNPGDYGISAGNSGDDPLSGNLDNPANGPDGNISVTILERNNYFVILDETPRAIGDPATYLITTTDPDSLAILSDSLDGSFEITGIPIGTAVNLSISAEGYVPIDTTVVVDIPPRAVDDPAATKDLGVLDMDLFSGALSGTVSFSNNPGTLPEATVVVRNADTGREVAEATTTNQAFSIAGLVSGRYALWIQANGYGNSRVVDVDYDNGQFVDVGEVVLDPGCGSEFFDIQLVGEFTGTSSFDIPSSPHLAEVAPCVWEATVNIASTGVQTFKFVTEGSFDEPEDYGGMEGTELSVPGTHSVLKVDSGDQTAIKIDVPAAGTYKFTLSEQSLEFTVEGVDVPSGTIAGNVAFLGVGSPPFPEATVTLLRAGNALISVTTAVNTGDYQITNVIVGTYDLRIEADGFIRGTATGITVAEDQTTNADPVTLNPSTSVLRGVVAFSDAPDSRPQATVEVRRSLDNGLVDETTTMDTFVFSGLPDDTYDIVFSAVGYRDTTVADQGYTSAMDLDLGTVTLQRQQCATTFTTIQLAGDFNGFNLGQAPNMELVSGCVWVDTLGALPVGVYNLKFVTDGAFDNPQDYGGNETELQAPGTFPTMLASGIGTALRVNIPEAGDWVFTLNEEVPEFTVGKVGGVLAQGAVSGTVAFTGITAGPFPRAAVELLDAGTTTVVRSTTSSAADGTFLMETVADGSYDLRVSAPCFAEQTVAGVAVSGAETMVGTVTLAAGTSALTSIQVVGEFTGASPFDLGTSPFMTQGPDCVWTDTLTVPVGTFLFKFVTDGAFDTPQDYGGVEADTLFAPGTFGAVPVSGQGTALRINVTEERDYLFTLDERSQQFTVAPFTPSPGPARLDPSSRTLPGDRRKR